MNNLEKDNIISLEIKTALETIMKQIWNKIDDFLGKLANWLLVGIIIAILWALVYKTILGRYMMYEDYYDKKVQSEQTR